MRYSLCATVSLLLSLQMLPLHAGSYEYHPGSVLKLGGTFDPQNLTVSYPSCIRYQREYAVHRLHRKEFGQEPAPRPRPAAANPARGQTPAPAAATPAGGTPPGMAPEAPQDEIQPNVAAENELSIEQIKTREHLYKFLNISTSVSGQYKFFSASASFNYESEETFDSDSFVFGVRGITTFAELGLIDPELTDDAKRLVANREAFYTRCGREWVSQESRGVLIAVVYTIKNVSQSQRSKLEASISGGFNGVVLSVNVEGKLKQIFESAFISNYYSARIHAVGGNGVSEFATTINQIDNPAEVLKKISEYMGTLKYENSVPLRFTTGSLDQFLAQEQPQLMFDTFNRRISDLFISYEEYRTQRARVWRFLTDDLQSGWASAVDDSAWERLNKLDTAIGRIEAKAQVCRKVAAIATDFSLAARPSGGSRGTPAPSPLDRRKAEFVRDFSIGISGRLATKPIKDYAAAVAAPEQPSCEMPGTTTTTDEVESARSALCECVKKDDTVFVKGRFAISATPHVKVIHEKTVFAPRTLLYISVTAAAKLSSVTLKDQAGSTVMSLKGGFDPDSGPVWFGSVLFRNGSGTPPAPETLPYYVEINDALGRTYTKPIMPID